MNNKTVLLYSRKENNFLFEEQYSSKRCISFEYYLNKEMLIWEIYNTKGEVYKIIEIQKVRWCGLFGYSPLYKGRSIYVHLDIKKAYDINLNELKSHFSDIISSRSSFLGTGRFSSNLEVLNTISNVNSYYDLFKIFK